MGKSLGTKRYTFNLSDGRKEVYELIKSQRDRFVKLTGVVGFGCDASCKGCAFTPGSGEGCGQGFYLSDVMSIEEVEIVTPWVPKFGDIVSFVSGFKVVNTHESFGKVYIESVGTKGYSFGSWVKKEEIGLISRPVQKIEHTILCTPENFKKVESLLESFGED